MDDPADATAAGWKSVSRKVFLKSAKSDQTLPDPNDTTSFWVSKNEPAPALCWTASRLCLQHPCFSLRQDFSKPYVAGIVAVMCICCCGICFMARCSKICHNHLLLSSFWIAVSLSCLYYCCCWRVNQLQKRQRKLEKDLEKAYAERA